MSFLKAQVIFPSNFPSIFSAVKNNSSVRFQLKHVILGYKQLIKACVRYFLMSTCLPVFVLPENQKFMSSWLTLPLHLLLQVKGDQQFSQKKNSIRSKLNDVQAFPDRIKSVLRACSEGEFSWMHFRFASNKAHLYEYSRAF